MITRRGTLALPVLAAPAVAQAWPDRPIRLRVCELMPESAKIVGKIPIISKGVKAQTRFFHRL